MLTKDQITWQAVTGAREVKRLPSHFIPVFYKSHGNTTPSSNLWALTWAGETGQKPQRIANGFRSYLETNYSGRYFIAINLYPNHYLPVIKDNTILVAFEEPSEASFFMLQVEFLVDTILKELEEKNILT